MCVLRRPCQGKSNESEQICSSDWLDVERCCNARGVQPYQTHDAGNLREIPPPAAMDSSQVNLNIGPDGTPFLSWIEYSEKDVPESRFATLKDQKWSAAKPLP